jgi:hypothetical protein
MQLGNGGLVKVMRRACSAADTDKSRAGLGVSQANSNSGTFPGDRSNHRRHAMYIRDGSLSFSRRVTKLSIGRLHFDADCITIPEMGFRWARRLNFGV